MKSSTLVSWSFHIAIFITLFLFLGDNLKLERTQKLQQRVIKTNMKRIIDVELRTYDNQFRLYKYCTANKENLKFDCYRILAGKTE